MLNGKTVLITGGTGSFGKKFTRTILEKYPNIKKIIIFSRDEFKQFEMSNEFKDHLKKLRFFLGDVRDKDRLTRAFYGVDVVIHAAALKQVPACEYNPFEAVKTNVLGAQNVINCALDCGIKKVVALSTDKACAPVNLYGATKLCSDKLFLAANSYVGDRDTKFSVVRYGNVSGSRGSVIPFFRKLVLEGAKEIPITDFRMTRFWLMLEEAVEMVLLALENMCGGELFIKKIPSVKVVDIAEAIAPDIKKVEVGVRQGEKIHEQMITQEDARHTADCGGFFVVYHDLKQIEKYNYKLVPDGFEYHSGNNDQWLSVEQIRGLLKNV